jgi:hypothetical protein
MGRMGGRFFKPTVALGALGLAIGLLAGLNVLISGIPTPGPIVGVVDDWTHHHVVFSNPGTAAQVLAEGRFEQWYKIVNDPRYIMQQMRRNPMQRAMAMAPDFAARMALLQPPIVVLPLRIAKEPPKQILTKDWNVNVGPIGVGSGNFPAKFSFNSAPSCSDLAVFNTSEAGSSTSATVMGITNLYGGTPAGELNCTGSPTVAWAYNTSNGDATDKVVTSVVFSLTGTEIAFISTDGTSAYLNLLRFESTSGNGTAYASPVAPATISTTGSNYVTCKQGSGSCLLRLKFTVGNDTISSPYYDYTSDTLWVGDASGNIHAFKPIFNGATGEVGTPWASTGATTALASPVYDGTYVYLAGANGLMYAFVAKTGAKYATSAAITSTTAGLGITDGALLDVVNSVLYVAVGYDANHDSGVTQISTPSLATLSEVYFGGGSTTVPVFTGTFDNSHYVAGGTTGYISTCSSYGAVTYFNPIAIAGFVSGARTLYSNVAGDVDEEVANAAVVCSPQTEILSSNGDDYIFLSVARHAHVSTAPTGCANGAANACLYSFQVGTSSGYTWTTAAAPGYGFKIPENTQTASSTSGIIVDNSASNGSNIYFTTNATTNGSPCTATTDGCAIQVTQAAP